MKICQHGQFFEFYPVSDPTPRLQVHPVAPELPTSQEFGVLEDNPFLSPAPDHVPIENRGKKDHSMQFMLAEENSDRVTHIIFSMIFVKRLSHTTLSLLGHSPWRCGSSERGSHLHQGLQGHCRDSSRCRRFCWH